MVISRYFHPAIEPLPAFSVIAAGMDRDDVARVGQADSHPSPVRIGRAATFDTVLVRDEPFLVEPQPAI